MRRFVFFVLLAVGIACAHAAPTYTTSSATVRCVGSGCAGWGYAPLTRACVRPAQQMQTQCIMTGGATYSSTIYQPFNNAAPSEYVDGKAPAGPKKIGGFGPRPDGPPSQDSPLGEPWILAAFALLFGGVMVWRKKMNVKREK